MRSKREEGEADAKWSSAPVAAPRPPVAHGPGFPGWALLPEKEPHPSLSAFSPKGLSLPVFLLLCPHFEPTCPQGVSFLWTRVTVAELNVGEEGGPHQTPTTGFPA